jgi:aryl-phospho-beta-D-glucosidase BglC (GH1 family)
MPSAKNICFSFFLFFSLLNNAEAQGFLKAKDKQMVNEKGENVLLRGIGLGGWMLQEGYMLGLRNNWQQQNQIRKHIDTLIGKEGAKAFYDAWLSNHTTKKDIDALKAWGFNSVRLPMHYNLYTLPIQEEPVAGQQTWLEKGFAMTDSLLNWCRANKMYLILDLHAAPGGQGNDLNIADRDPSLPSLWQSAANQQKMIALWKKLAARYAHEPWIGGYDIINEPNWGFQDTMNDRNGLKEKINAPLRQLMMDITKAIREVDNQHIIIIEGNGWGNNYNGILPAWDANMVLSFHKYWNYNDQQSISHILKMREENNMPVWLGETGENSNVWFTEAIRLFEQNNIGWAWWPLKKLGFNNPLQVKTNKNYTDLLAYWNGETRMPPAKEAVYSGLMGLAADTKFENNILHPDVIDAMVRQPFSNATLPFKQNNIDNNTVLNSVDYDLGINGAAYFDNDTADYHISTQKRTAGNRGRVYRNDGVDIRKDSALEDSYFVSDIEDGEWLQYTVNVAEKGIYHVVLMIACRNEWGRITLKMDDSVVTQNQQVTSTNGMHLWQAFSAGDISLNAGKHVLRMYALRGGFNLQSIRFSKVK